MNDFKWKLDLAYIEDNVAWLECKENDFTLDIPTQYDIDYRTFDIDENTTCYWCYSNEHKYHFVAQKQHYILILFCNVTDMGFEILNGHIYHVKQKETLH